MKMKKLQYRWQQHKRLKYIFYLSIEYMFCRQLRSFYRWLYRHRENCEELAEQKFLDWWNYPLNWQRAVGFSTLLIDLVTCFFFGSTVFFLCGGGSTPDHIQAVIMMGMLLLFLLSTPFWDVLDPSAHPVHKEFLQWPHERRRRWCRRSLRILAFLLFFPWTVKLLLWLTGNESFVTLLMKIWG